MTVTAAVLLAAALAVAPSSAVESSTETLERNVAKVDQAIAETERLIATSSDAPYLPDLQFRLAELIVEKSRYVHRLQDQRRPAGARGPVSSTQTRLLKQKAMQLYDRILTVFPTYRQADKVNFYLAHEQRELGQLDEMRKTLRELTVKFPKSPLRLEAEQILGDYHFDKADNAQAEKHYLAVLSAPPSPVHDLARYKLGWIRVNQAKHAEAVTYFEAAARSPAFAGADAAKSLDVKREALLDLVYSYTEVRPARSAIAYFERLCDSPHTCALVLEKLASRYFVKQQYENAVPVLRRLLETQTHQKLDSERVFRLEEALRLARPQVPPLASDVAFVVRAGQHVRTDWTRGEADRKRALDELEEVARDLSTQLHLAAQRTAQKADFAEAAEAYRHYLSLFRPPKHARALMQNRADALYASGRYFEAGQQFEALARRTAQKDRKRSLYGAVLAYTSALHEPEGKRAQTAFTKRDARQAVKQLGAQFAQSYPKDRQVPGIRFNIARAHFDDGEFHDAAELFTSFALAYPLHKDAQAASYLALDSLRHLQDFEGLETTGKKLLASKLPAGFRAKLEGVVARARTEALDALALAGAEETGDVVEGLAQVAEQHRGLELGEKALHAAVAAAREERDFPREKALAQKFLQQYPQSSAGAEVLSSLARSSAEGARYQEAAGYFAQAARKLRSDPRALELWRTAGMLQAALTQTQDAVRSFEAAAALASSPAAKADLKTLVAEAAWKGKDSEAARAAALEALRLDGAHAKAAALIAELDAQGGATQLREELLAPLSGAVSGEHAEWAARGLWYVAEVLYRQFKQLPAEAPDQLVTALQQLEALYAQAASAGSAEWAIASMWRSALLYQHMARVIPTAPVPRGASAAEAAQWRAELKAQSAALASRADETFALCVSKAESLVVFSDAALGCRQRTEDAKPKLPPSAARLASVGEELLRRAGQRQDAAAMEALGLAYLAKGSAPLAQLTLARATELAPSPRAHNALGVVALMLGEPMAARASYEKALESGPSDKAHANLAALRCRFGDGAGARKELSRIRNPSAVEGPDVDSHWRVCK